MTLSLYENDGKRKMEKMIILSFTEYEQLVNTAAVAQNRKPVTKTGKWIVNQDTPDKWLCSCCRRQWDVCQWERKRMRYCPNCGSYMCSEQAIQEKDIKPKQGEKNETD